MTSNYAPGTLNDKHAPYNATPAGCEWHIALDADGYREDECHQEAEGRCAVCDLALCERHGAAQSRCPAHATVAEADIEAAQDADEDRDVAAARRYGRALQTLGEIGR